MQPLSSPSRVKTLIDILSAMFVAYFSAIALFIIAGNPAHPPRSPWPLYIRISDASIPLCTFGAVWLIARYHEAITRRFPLIDKDWFRILLALAALSFPYVVRQLWR